MGNYSCSLDNIIGLRVMGMNKIADSLWEKQNIQAKKDRNFLIVLFTIFCVVITIVILFTHVFFFVDVEGKSMEKTLKDGNVIIARYDKEPTRSSIIVIKGEYEKGNIIKRLIAVEGDTVKFSNGKVYIRYSGQTEFIELKEDYAYGRTDYVKPTEEQKQLHDFGLSIYGDDYVTVAEGEYFYLGDNRQNSNDSRYYGTCEKWQIVGVVEEISLGGRTIRGKIFDFLSAIFPLDKAN